MIALVYIDYDFIVFKNEKGFFHSVNQAAVQHKGATRQWYLNGRMHNPYGIAIFQNDPRIIRQWRIHGVEVTEDEHKKRFNL